MYLEVKCVRGKNIDSMSYQEHADTNMCNQHQQVDHEGWGLME